MALAWKIALIMTRVARNCKVSSWIFGISMVPIKFHIALKSLIHQKFIEEVAKVIVVGLFFERERAGVLEEHAKLWWEPMEQGKRGDSLFRLENVLSLNARALPWQKAPNEVK